MKSPPPGTVCPFEFFRRVVAVGRTLWTEVDLVPAVDVTLPPDTESPRRARRLVETALSQDPSEVVDVVTLLVSEAVTNAVLHAGTEVRVRIGRDGSSVRVEVADASLDEPQLRHHSPEAATGNGLLLISELSDAWGLQVGDDGKTVWFELSAGTPRS